MAGKQTLTQRITLEGGKEIQAELEALGASGKRVWKELQDAAASFKGPDSSAVAKLKDIQAQLVSMGKSFQDTGRALKDVGSGLSTYITAPLAAAGVGIVKVAADFETGMIKLKTATQASGEELQKLEATAREIGKNSLFSPGEAAAAMTELAKTGVSTTDILNGAAKAVVDFATANDAQLAPAAKVAAQVMGDFNISAHDLPAALNDVSGTVNASVLSFEDYQQAIGQAGGIIGQLGISLSDFNTVLGSTSKAFSSGSDAATSFKTFLGSLVGNSKEAKDKMKELGIEFFDANGKFKGLGAAADILQTKLKGLSEKDLIDALKTMFGSDAWRTGITLMKQGSAGLEEFNRVKEKFSQSKAAEDRMAGFNGQMAQLKGSLEELAIVIGKSGLLEFITGLVKGLSEFVDRLSTTSPAVLRFAVVFGAIAAAIGPVLFALGVMSTGLGTLLKGFGAISGVLARLIPAFGSLGAAVAGGGVFATLGRAALALVTGPLGRLLGWPALFAAALVGIVGNWDSIVADAQRAADDIPSAFERVKIAILRALSGDWAGAFDELTAAAKAAYDALQKYEWFNGIVDEAKKTFETTKNEWNALVQFFKDHPLTLEEFDKETEGLEKAIETALDFTENQWDEFVEFFRRSATGDWPGAWELMKKPVTDAGTAIQNAFLKMGVDAEQARLRIDRALRQGGSLPFGELGSNARQQFNAISEAATIAARDADREMRVAAERMRDSLSSVGTAAEKVGAPVAALADTIVKVFRDGKEAASEYKVVKESALKPAGAVDPSLEREIKVWRGISQAARESAVEKAKAGLTGKDAADAEAAALAKVGDGWSTVKVKGEAALAGMSTGLDAVKGKLDTLSQSQQQGIFGGLVKQAQDAQLGISKEFDGVPAAVAKSLEGLKLTAQQFQVIPDEVKKAVEAAGLEFKKLGNGSLQLVDKAKLATEGQSIVDAAKKTADGANAALSKTGEPLKDIAKDAAKPLADTRTDAQKTADAITKSFEAVKGFDWAKFGEGSKAAFTELVAGSASGKTALESFKTALDALPLAAIKVALDGIGTALTALLTPLSTFDAAAAQTFDRIIAKAKEAAAAVASAFSGGAAPAQDAAGAASDAGQGLATGASGAFSGIETSAKETFERLKTLATETATGIGASFSGLVVDWAPFLTATDTGLWAVLKTKATETALEVKTALENIRIDWTQVTGGIQAVIDAVRSIGTEATSAAASVSTAASGMVQSFNEVAAAAREAAQAAASVGSGGSSGSSTSDFGVPADAFASGGHVRGPGTGTSDSIRAWLSNGEFVVRAAAVRRYGKDFLAALNAGRLKLPAFARGGLVAAPSFKMGLPAFSTGGLVDNMRSAMSGLSLPAPQLALAGLEPSGNLRPAVINIGGESFTAQVPEDSLRRMQQAAGRKVLTRAGRKNGWHT